MSGKGKKSGKKSSNKSIGDVTINDFANAKVCKNRPKKSINSVSHAMKQLEVNDRSWDEKDDYDDDFDFIEEENEDGSTSFVLKPRRRKKTLSEVERNNREGADYPLDIWFLISEYIAPEDVRRFGGICRSTYAVICSAKFWFDLYKRYYNSVPNLPERLQPECMVRMYGLKSCVIRALHYMYPPFVYRINSILTLVAENPHSLVKRQCILMWHKKCKDKWLYSFKLKEHSMLRMSRYQKIEQPDLLEMLQDVMANQEEGCRILQVACPYFVPAPPVLGLTLTSVTKTLSQGFRHHRLQMGFGSGLSYSSRPLDASNSIEIIFDPVINMRVLDWWHPRYPHSQTMPLLNQD